LENHLDGATGQHLPFLEPANVRRDADDAVRIVANEVRLDEMPGNALGLFGLAAGGGKDCCGQSAEPFVLDVHGLDPDSSCRTNLCSEGQDAGTTPRQPPADHVTSATYTSP